MRVLIADIHREAYQSLKKILQAEKEITVVGYAPTAEEALYRVPYCDLVLVGESLLKQDGCTLIGQLLEKRPEVKVLVTGLSEEVGEIIRYVEVGASGYILKRDSSAALLQKVRAAHRNRAVVSPQMAASLMAHLAELSTRTHSPSKQSTLVSFEELTPREREVLDLLAEELSNRQIANRLHIQVGTVKNHVHHILKKLNVNDRYEAATSYVLWQQRKVSPQAYVTL